MLPETEHNATATQHDLNRLLEAIAALSKVGRLEIQLNNRENQPNLAVEYESSPQAVAVESSSTQLPAFENRLPQLAGFDPQKLMASEPLQLRGTDYVDGEIVADPSSLSGDSDSLRQLPASTQTDSEHHPNPPQAEANLASAGVASAGLSEPRVDIKIGSSQLSGTVSEVSQQFHNLSPEQQSAIQQAMVQPSGQVIQGEAVSIAVDGETVLSRDSQGQMQINEIEPQLSPSRSDSLVLEPAHSRQFDMQQSPTLLPSGLPADVGGRTEVAGTALAPGAAPTEIDPTQSADLPAEAAEVDSQASEVGGAIPPTSADLGVSDPPELKAIEPVMLDSSLSQPNASEAEVTSVQFDAAPVEQPHLEVLPVGEIAAMTGMQLGDSDTLDGNVAAVAPSAVVSVDADGKVKGTADLRGQVEATEDKIESGEIAVQHAHQAEAQTLSPEAVAVIGSLKAHFQETGTTNLVGQDYTFQDQLEGVTLIPHDSQQAPIEIVGDRVEPAIDTKQYDQLMQRFSSAYERIQVAPGQDNYEQDYERG